MSYRILLNKIEDVKRFVALMSKYSFTGRIKQGRYVVDATSLLGVFSLNLSLPVNLEIDDNITTDEIDKFLDDIKPFMVDEI